MSLDSRFDPSTVEEKWYSYWVEKKLFHSEPDNRKAYTVVIPPPNVTGVLHMGHMLNNTIQDVLVRRARMLGFNACWVPGTDHASIATEAKVVNMLKERADWVPRATGTAQPSRWTIYAMRALSVCLWTSTTRGLSIAACAW